MAQVIEEEADKNDKTQSNHANYSEVKFDTSPSVSQFKADIKKVMTVPRPKEKKQQLGGDYDLRRLFAKAGLSSEEIKRY
jgi:hypothetical protein